MLNNKSLRRIGQSVQHTEENPLYGVVESHKSNDVKFIDVDNRIFVAELDYTGSSVSPYDGVLKEYDLDTDSWIYPLDLPIPTPVKVIEVMGLPLEVGAGTAWRYLVLRCAYDEDEDLYYAVVSLGQYAGQLTPGITSLDHANPSPQKMGTGPKEFDYVITDGLISTDLVQINMDENYDATWHRVFDTYFLGEDARNFFTIWQFNQISPIHRHYVSVNGAASFLHGGDSVGHGITLFVNPEGSELDYVESQMCNSAHFSGGVVISKGDWERRTEFRSDSGVGYNVVEGFLEGNIIDYRSPYGDFGTNIACGLGIDDVGGTGFGIEADYYSINGTKGITITEIGMQFTGGLRTGGTVSISSGNISDFNAAVDARLDQGTW